METPQLSLLAGLPGDIHLWSLAFPKQSWSVQGLWRLLSEGERTRAEGYVLLPDQRAFIIRRGFLRLLLARYLDTEPAAVPLCTSPLGKPYLLAPHDHVPLHFNLSRSDTLVVYAVAPGEIGVDVERISADIEADAVSAWACSPSEQADLAALPAEGQLEAAVRLWACKEAYLKACGTGLTHPPNQVEVSLSPGGARLVRIAGDREEATRWYLHEVTPSEGYRGAVVYRAC